MKRVDRLFVLWRDPAGARRVIGELWRTSDGFAFGYAQSLPSESDGFMLLSEFPEPKRIDAPYAARYLFPTFAQRIPGPGRPDRSRLLAEWGVTNSDDPLEILARSGGAQLTDRIELAEHRSADDELRDPLDFRISGATQPRFAEAATKVIAGAALALKREPDNQHDCHATIVLESAGMPLGYVPKQYSKMVAGLLDRGVGLHATAQRMLIAPDAGRWVVRVSRR